MVCQEPAASYGFQTPFFDGRATEGLDILTKGILGVLKISGLSSRDKLRATTAAVVELMDEEASLEDCQAMSDAFGEAAFRRDFTKDNTLSAAEFGKACGVTRTTVNNWRAANKVLGLPWGEGSYRYQPWQVKNGQLVAGLDVALEMLAKHFEDPYDQAIFMTTEDESEDGEMVSPADLLRQGSQHAATKLIDRLND